MCSEIIPELCWHLLLVGIMLYICTDQNAQHFVKCRCLVSFHVTYNNISATNFSMYLRHFRIPVPLLGFTAIGVSCHIKFKHKIDNIFGLEKLLWTLLESREKKYHTSLPLLQTLWVTFCSIDCKGDFHRKKYHHPEVRNTNKWCCCLNINAKVRNWETIKNKPFASKQLFLKVHVFTVFSNKYIFFGLRLARKCGLEEPESRSQEFPLGPGYGIPELLLWAHQIDPPHHHFSSCKTERYLLSLIPSVVNLNE